MIVPVACDHCASGFFLLAALVAGLPAATAGGGSRSTLICCSNTPYGCVTRCLYTASNSSGPGFGEQLAARLDGERDRLGHRDLLRPRPVAGDIAGKRSVGVENRTELGVAQRRPFSASRAP